MTLEEMGVALRTEREKRRLTIDDVANDLKINARMLTALENGDQHALPPPAYVRGFIRSYGKAMGFGEEEIQGWIDNLDPAATPLRMAEKEAAAPGKSGGSRKVLLALVLLGAIAAGGYWAYTQGLVTLPKFEQEAPPDLDSRLPPADKYLAGRDAERARSDASKPKVEKTEEAVPQPVKQTPAPTPPANDKAGKPALAQTEVSLPPETAQAVATVSETAKKAAEPAPASAGESENSAGNVPSQHKLIITATEACWVHSSADKTDRRQFSLRKGDIFTLIFVKELELKLGNAGGVRLRYDGKDLPAPGTSGQVKTIKFPPED